MTESKFTLQALETLQRYFPTEQSGADKLSFHRLKGYLTAVACAPVTVPFAEWWGALKALPELDIESEQAENELLPLMMTLMDKSLESLVVGQAVLPEPVELSQYDYGASPVEQWCRGFMDGLKLSEEAWFSIGDEKEIENLEIFFGVVAMLATRENMRRKVDAGQFEERMNAAQQTLPQVVEHLYKVGKSHR